MPDSGYGHDQPEIRAAADNLKEPGARSQNEKQPGWRQKDSNAGEFGFLLAPDSFSWSGNLNVLQLKRVFEGATQSGALRDLSARLQQGARVLRIEGPVAGVMGLIIARAALAEGRSLAVLTGSGKEASDLAQEVGFFLGLLSSEPPPVVFLPSLEVDPYRGLSPHPDIAAARAHAIWQLLQDGPAVVVASVRAAAVRLHSRERFLSYCVDLDKNQPYSPELLRDYLLETGYLEDDPGTDAGEFSLRGGILDIYPPIWNTLRASSSSATRLNRCVCSTWIPSVPFPRSPEWS